MTEKIDKRYVDLDTWSVEQILEALLSSNARALSAVQDVLDDLTRAAEGIAERLDAGGRLVYAGAGTSGRLALQDAAELPPTFGFERTLVLLAGGDEASEKAAEGAEDDAAAARRAIEDAVIGPEDAVIGIAASGKTPYTVAAVQAAGAAGAFTVGVANNASTPLLAEAEVALFLNTGPEVLAGSTRLAAGTAQKVVLNALSTAALIRLGGAYQNLMVGMTPVNEKLRGRAVSIVSRATGVSEEKARVALSESDGQIREAIVMIGAGVSLAEAKGRLERSNGRVREALENKSPP